MALQVSPLRPGLFVNLTTSLRGNVSYQKIDIERPHITADGEERAKWETERTIADPTEFERAQKARGKAGTVIRSVCASASFGLLCRQADRDKLEAAITEARSIVDEFNATSDITKLRLSAMVWEVKPDDVEAVKEINRDVRDLLRDMTTGLERLDVRMIRDAASKARDLGSMLTPDAASRIKVAVETARSAARQIAKAGETASLEVDRQAIEKITDQRTAFLDLDDEGGVEVSLPERGRALDFEPAPVSLSAAPASTYQLDLI